MFSGYKKDYDLNLLIIRKNNIFAILLYSDKSIRNVRIL